MAWAGIIWIFGAIAISLAYVPLIEKVQNILMDPKNLELATKLLNEKVKQRMAENPENTKLLTKRKLDVEKDLRYRDC